MFTGFPDEMVDFLWGIRFNNERSWFEAHKSTYLTQVQQPMRELGAVLYEYMNREHPELWLNLHVSRIYRDARRLFGRGPYKDHLWLSLRHENENWTSRPVFFFEIAPENWSYGMGFYSATPQIMARFRREAAEAPARLEQLAKTLNAQAAFALEGDTYVRSKPAPSPLLQPWFDRKSLALICYRPYTDDAPFSGALLPRLQEGFEFLLPYYEYFSALCREDGNN